MDTRSTPTANDRTKAHLVEISSGFDIDRTGLLVVGDSAEDFALSRLWRLVFGIAYWVPSALGVDDDTVPWSTGYAVARIARDLARNSNRLAITSMSRPTDDLHGTRDRLLAANPIANPDEDRTALPIISSSELPWRQETTVGLAVQDQWDSQITVPVSVMDDGTRRMAAPLPAPALRNDELAEQASLQWQVDVLWRPGNAVLRRGIDSQELFADSPPFMLTWARSSRHGVT